MPIYKAPVDDAMFLLNDVFQIGRYNNLPGFADATPELIEAVLSEAGKLAEEVLQPLNRAGDKEGCTRHDDGSVTTPKGFKEAYKQYAEGGWIGHFGADRIRRPGPAGDDDRTWSTSSWLRPTWRFAMYPGLTQGAIAAISTHGTPEQKAAYLPKMIEGRWTGTMNLTEPHCGTDLGLLRTKAVKQARRQLQDHRHQDFHLGRRARPRRQHRASGAGAASTARRPASAASRCSSCRNSCPRPTARSAPATACPAARSSRRWASTATPPA